MQLAPTFKDQWDAIATRFQKGQDDEAKLSAYKDAMTLVLKEEQAAAQYDNMTDANKEAQRLMAKISQSTIEQAWEPVVQTQQLAVDSAWMVPIYNEKAFYVTDPRLSGIVLNKLSWGGVFQFQYLQWQE